MARKKRVSKKTRQPKAKTVNRNKETVRVKTFIVERPVYIEAPTRFQRLKQKIPLYSANESRYAKAKKDDEEYGTKTKNDQTDFEDGAVEETDVEDIDSTNDEYLDDASGGEGLDSQLEEGGGEDYADIDEKEGPVHSRSNGLFDNVWWKKGILKGILAWLVIVVVFYIFDFLGLVEVVDAKRWLFFLVLLLVLGMGYQKYLSGRVAI